MKIGYPDTINNKAYNGPSPLKAIDESKADLNKDGNVSDYEENRAEAAFGSEAPLNYSPLQVREMSDKRRARRKKRVEKIEAKVVKNSELKPIKGVADEDIQYTAKKGKEKKVDRLSKKADRISDKTTKILRDNNQVPSAKKKPVVAKAKESKKAVPKVKKKTNTITGGSNKKAVDMELNAFQRAYSDKHGSSSGGSDQEFSAYQRGLAKIRKKY